MGSTNELRGKPGGPIEQPAVRTTIVGGRPPGCGQAVGVVPRGVEVLVKKAAVDPAFKAALLARRSATAGDIGLTLAPAEMAMLDAVPVAQLEAIIARTRVDDRIRPAFLGKVAGVMLVALGAGAIAGGLEGCQDTQGIRPDRDGGSRGLRPDPTTAPANPSSVSQLSEMAGDGGPPAEATAMLPPGPRVAQASSSAGISPDRPRVEFSAGIGSDRPSEPDRIQARDKLFDIIQMNDSFAPTWGIGPDRPVAAGPRPEVARPQIASATSQPATVQSPTTQPARAAATQPAITDQIDRLVGQLDAKEAADRDAAQRSLVELGLPVVAPRLKELLGSKALLPEARRRAGQIVQTFNEIRELIEQLAEYPRNPIAIAGAWTYGGTQEGENRLLEIGPIALPMLKEAQASKRLLPGPAERFARIIKTLEDPAKGSPPQSQPDRGTSP